MKSKQLRTLVRASVFAALIFCATFFIKIPIPGSGGYVHPGDTLIYMAALFLPWPYAAAAAAIGAGLSDLAAGYAIYAPWTVVLKALMACAVAFTAGKKNTLRLLLAGVLAGLINIVGYYIAEWVITGNFFTPIASLPFNLIQSCFAVAAFIIIIKFIPKKLINY